MPAAVEPWLSHLGWGELEGGRRLNGGRDVIAARRAAAVRGSAGRRFGGGAPPDFIRGLPPDIPGAAGDRLRRDPDQKILDAVVVDDAVGGVAHDVEVELAGDVAADDPV